MPDLQIPQATFDRFAARAKEKGFASTEAYLLWLLEQMAEKLPTNGTPGAYTDQEKEMVQDRLRALGYID